MRCVTANASNLGPAPLMPPPSRHPTPPRRRHDQHPHRDGDDPFSPEFQADPYPVYRWMREEAPVFYSEKWNWWALSRFEDVRAAATDPDTFLSYEGIDIDDTAKDQSGPRVPA